MWDGDRKALLPACRCNSSSRKGGRTNAVLCKGSFMEEATWSGVFSGCVGTGAGQLVEDGCGFYFFPDMGLRRPVGVQSPDLKALSSPTHPNSSFVLLIPHPLPVSTSCPVPFLTCFRPFSCRPSSRNPLPLSPLKSRSCGLWLPWSSRAL